MLLRELSVLWKTAGPDRLTCLPVIICHTEKFYETVARVGGRRTRIVVVPEILLLAAGAVGSLFESMGVRTEINLPNMRILCLCNYYTGAKSRKELDVEYRSVEQAVRDALLSIV